MSLSYLETKDGHASGHSISVFLQTRLVASGTLTSGTDYGHEPSPFPPYISGYGIRHNELQTFDTSTC